MSSKDADALWQGFARVTRARIGLGRTGDALPTQPLLDFQYAHACARDAVSAQADFAALAAGLAPVPTLYVHSDAADRSTYLRRPDRGRRLDRESAARLDRTLAERAPGEAYEAVFVIADGLSASAVQRHALPMFAAAAALLSDWRIAPVVLAEQARVALGDEIGVRLGAAMSIVLIGERPGLTVPHSLGIYLTYAPQVGRRDAERNCISNIHADGLSYEAAAVKLAWLMSQARRLRLTGVGLKEDAGGGLLPAGAAQKQLDSAPTELRSSEQR
jgi:ethanolamine ammonia-lyase small subunit